MEDDLDFNSSDIEFDAPPTQNPWAAAGRESIDSMLSRALDERLKSKKLVKQLQYNVGSPATQYHDTLWWNRFMDYRKSVLKEMDTTAVPSSTALERFLSSIPGHVRPPVNSVPSYAWLQRGMASLVSQSLFHHKEFKLGAHERCRLKALFATLLKDGKITKDPSFERRWIGVLLVRKLVTGLIDNALERGTASWDNVIQKVLHIVLASALAVRNQDITKGAFDVHESPYLIWQDISLRLDGGDTIDHLIAVVTIRNEKGKKTDAKLNRKCLIKAQTAPENAIICPVKLLLIHALRLGFVAETSIDELMRHTRRRPNKTVIWTKPKGPVLCKARKGAGLFVDRDAGPQSFNHTMTEASQASGILVTLRPHDLRRGAAREVANLRNNPLVGAANPASAALGHTLDGGASRITSHYVGGLAEDVWSKRIDEDFRELVEVVPEAAGSSYRKRKRISVQAVNDYCQNESLDEKNRLHRRQAARALGKQGFDKWVTHEEQLLKTIVPDKLEVNENDSHRKRRKLAVPTLHDKDDVEEEEELDEADTNLVAQVSDTVLSSGTGIAAGPSQEMQHLIIEMMMPQHSTILSGDALTVVRRLSSINIVRNMSLAIPDSLDQKYQVAYRAALPFYQGGSRDPVSAFQLPCKNAVFGCPFTMTPANVWRHEATCRYTSIEVGHVLGEKAAKDAAAKLEFQCPFEGCGRAFTTAARLKEHRRAVHDWPRPCGAKGCDPNITYDSLQALSAHKAAAGHTGWLVAPCNYPMCKNTTTQFKTAAEFRQHLVKTHKISKEKLVEYMPVGYENRQEKANVGEEERD